MRHTIRFFLSLCMAAVCTASNAQVSDSSCSASVKPLEATRALTQSALLACSVVLQPTGALEWLIDVQQVRLRDILDGRLVDTVELPAHCGVTLAELVQQCWPSPALPVRAFLSELDQESHSRLCVSASVAAADALHNPILSLTKVILSVHSLPALPVAIAASVLPHATVAAVLMCFAPAAMVVSPLWTMAIVFFALVDLCHTPLRVVDAFHKSKKRVMTLLLRRMFAHVVMALFVAFIDSIATAVSSSTGVPLLAISSYIYCICYARHYCKCRSPWRLPFFAYIMRTFDSLWLLLVSSASIRDAADRLQQRALELRGGKRAQEFLLAINPSIPLATESRHSAPPDPSVPQAVKKFLKLIDRTRDSEIENMCTLSCSSGFFASDKGHGMQLNVRLMGDVLYFYPDGHHSAPYFTLPLLHAQSVQQEADGASSSLTVVLMSQFREYRIAFHSPIASQQWRKELSDRVDARNRLLTQQPQPLPAFPSASFPWRSDTGVCFHSPAANYFEAVADAIAAARTCVFIADWWLSPEIYLKRRELPPNPAWRLDNLLQHVAQKGVMVYVIFYKETPGTLQTNSFKAEKHLKRLHSNIRVLRHGPGFSNLYWSHHQKLVCVDYHTAFVGGIDLCFGRYDTVDMRLSDTVLPHTFIGVDYYNPSYHGCVNDELCDAFLDRPQLDRTLVPRMPWQDVAVSFDGEAANDVAMGFVQRWNNHTAFGASTRIEEFRVFPEPPATTQSSFSERCSVRVLRSTAEWSGGAKLECSVQEAWLWAIDQAQHFIYVEQQFFISSMGNEGTVSNTIAKAIVSKVVEKFEQRKAAAKSGQDLGPSFRVIILIPQSPEGDFTSDAGVRAIMFFQSKTIRTMLNEIVARTGETEPGKLILFASLRAKGDVCGKMHTNQCYIHSKMLIVDDAVAIIGSANVNDRSLCGDRDSEICVCVRDVPQKSDSQKLSPIMQFRMQLWNRYCGLSIDDTTSRNAATFADEFVRKCMENTAIYEAATCFCMPSQNITNMAQYARLTEEARKAHDASPDNAREQLQKIGGLLVMFPVNFLKEDTQLTPSLLRGELLALASSNLFT